LLTPSYWEKTSFFAPCDIVIAGGGFVGLWSAYYLKKNHPGLRITMIERGLIPTGASTRNAGFACFGSVTELVKDAATMGEDTMLSLVEMRFRGLSRITRLFRKKEIDYARVGGYELISPAQEQQYQDLGDQMHHLNKLLSKITGEKKTFRFSDENIGKFGFAGVSRMISNDLEGCLHPGKLCLMLAQKVAGMGVRIIPGTEITRFEDEADGIRVYTTRHITISAGKLLVCTNGFAKQLLPELDLLPARGQVLITSPIPTLRFKGTFHYDEGFYYFRNVGKRLLLGGARNAAIVEETTTDMTTTGMIQDTLESFISRHLLPGTPFDVTDRWSGIMGMGTEKMPIVKKVRDHVFCAVKMSGMGVALAPVAAETVAGMMC